MKMSPRLQYPFRSCQSRLSFLQPCNPGGTCPAVTQKPHRQPLGSLALRYVVTGRSSQALDLGERKQKVLIGGLLALEVVIESDPKRSQRPAILDVLIAEVRPLD